MFKLKVLSQVIAATAAASFLVGCSSGSSSGSASSDNTDVTGSIFASNVAGAKVLVTDGVNTIAGPVITSANGRFTVPVPNANLKGDLVFVATGGTYTDEATGEQATSGELSVMAGANTLVGNPSIHATPSSTIINTLISKHGLSKVDAKAAFKAAFGYAPDSTVEPVDATKANAEASDAARLAGVRAAGFSQLLADLGLSKNDHTVLIEALAEDLIDGSVDGMNNGAKVQLKGADVPADMANQFSTALMNFLNGAGKASGLNLGKMGLLKFNTKVMSETYTFELTPPMMTEVGKAVYKLKVTNKNGGVAATGMPMLMPKMYMGAGHKHSTPHTGCTAFDVEGVASCTVYFLMASKMGGEVAGNWDLGFTHDSETVHFFPEVMMAMGEDTSRLKLSGAKTDPDKVIMMGNDTGRNYFIYKDSIASSVNGHTVKFFVATQDSMMSFPALDETQVSVVLTVNGTTADAEGNGIWSVELAGLTASELATLSLTLNVDGLDKKLGTEIIAPFKVTPKN